MLVFIYTTSQKFGLKYEKYSVDVVNNMQQEGALLYFTYDLQGEELFLKEYLHICTQT